MAHRHIITNLLSVQLPEIKKVAEHSAEKEDFDETVHSRFRHSFSMSTSIRTINSKEKKCRYRFFIHTTYTMFNRWYTDRWPWLSHRWSVMYQRRRGFIFAGGEIMCAITDIANKRDRLCNLWDPWTRSDLLLTESKQNSARDPNPGYDDRTSPSGRRRLSSTFYRDTLSNHRRTARCLHRRRGRFTDSLNLLGWWCDACVRELETTFSRWKGERRVVARDLLDHAKRREREANKKSSRRRDCLSVSYRSLWTIWTVTPKNCTCFQGEKHTTALM